MKDSGYDSNSRVIERRAAGYAAAAGGGGALVNAGFVNMTIPGFAQQCLFAHESLILPRKLLRTIACVGKAIW